MAVTGKMYGQVPIKAFNKEIDWNSDDIRCTLHTVGYVPDQDVHDYVDDLSNEVAAGGGYVTGGVRLTTPTMTYTAATKTCTFDADDAVWASPTTITARVAAVSDRQTAVAGTSPLIVYQLSDVDVSSSAGEFRVQWNASGIFTVAVS